MPIKPAARDPLDAKNGANLQTRREKGGDNRQVEQEDFELKQSESESETNTMSSSESSVEFNWSEEETPEGENKEEVRAKRGRRLWLLFMKLARPVRVLIVGILGVAVCITPLLVVNVRFRETAAKTQIHVWSLWFAIIWAAACATYILVDFIPRLVIALTSLFGGNTERLKIEIDVTWAVKAWLKLLLDMAWTWISLSVLRTVYKPPGSYWTTINRVIQSLFSASVILFVEKVFLQFVAINFHQKALADRLAANRLGLRALDRLSNAHTPSPTKKPPYAKRGHKIPSSVGFFDFAPGTYPPHKVEGSTPEELPRPPPLGQSYSQARKLPKGKKKPMTSVIVDQVGDAIGQITLKNSKFHKEVDVTGLHSARRLARKLFSTLSNVNPPRSHLVVQDFYPYFRSTVEAHEAFDVFDKDGNGDISKSEMREAVQRIYLERKSLAAGLKDVGSIVAKLDGVLLCVSLIIIIFICLLIFNRHNTLASLVPLASIVLGFSFIFGNSAATLFESLIFIFSTHVFDVGDLVMIDDQVLFVKEFGLFSTTFRRVDGQEIIAPNSLLSKTKLVHNLRRSKSMWETTALTVSYDTPIEALEQLKAKIIAYISSNNREWSDCALNIDRMEYQNAIYLNVSVEHRPNWQDWGGRWTRRTAFMRYLKTVLEELEIRYTMPIQPVLLPQNSPFSQPAPQMQQPPSASFSGNAGFFQGSDYGRPSGPMFKDGVPHF